MNEEIKKAKESLEKLIEDISIDSGYSYPALYADIRTALNDFDKYYESQQDLIKGKDEYIAKLCNDRAELKEKLKQVEDFKYHYDRYKKELANKLKVINCMQEEATTNYNLIDSLEDRNDRLVERLEKQKAELKELRDFAKAIAEHTNINSLTIKGENEITISYFSQKWHTKYFDLVKKVVEKYGK